VKFTRNQDNRYLKSCNKKRNRTGTRVDGNEPAEFIPYVIFTGKGSGERTCFSTATSRCIPAREEALWELGPLIHLLGMETVIELCIVMLQIPHYLL